MSASLKYGDSTFELWLRMSRSVFNQATEGVVHSDAFVGRQNALHVDGIFTLQRVAVGIHILSYVTAADDFYE